MNRSKFDAMATRSLVQGSSAITQTRAVTLTSLENNPSLRGHELVQVSKIQPQAPAKRTRIPVLRNVLELAASIGENRLFQNLGVDPSYHIIFGGHRYIALRLLAIKNPLDRCRFVVHQVESGNLLAEIVELDSLKAFLALDDSNAQLKVNLIQLLGKLKKETPSEKERQQFLSSLNFIKGDLGTQERFLEAPNGEVAREISTLALSLASNEAEGFLEKLKKFDLNSSVAETMLIQLPFKDDLVPVLVFETKNDEERLLIEVLENQVRSNYTKDQVLAIAKSLMDRGYKFAGKGRPTLQEGIVPAEQRNLIPALSQLVRLSKPTIRKMLLDAEKELNPKAEPKNKAKETYPNLKKILKKIQTQNPNLKEWICQGLELLESKVG